MLNAAARVFARDGLKGSTTREIARVAGVNEVTLFRLFETKENLLAAVVGRTFGQDPTRPKPVLPKSTGNLWADLAAYARVYQSMLSANIQLIRTFLGEIHHHRSQERRVAEGIFGPMREEVIVRLKQAQKQGELRGGVRPAVAADLLNAMIFTGVLRRCGPRKPLEYAPQTYIEDCVDLFIHGIQANAGGRR